MDFRKNGNKIIFTILISILSSLFSGCYFFRKRDTGSTSAAVTTDSGVLGGRAGGLNRALLDGVHGIATDLAPAAIRPDPDLFVRRLLLQYREEGATVARQIGQVEQYRLLLGGASDDFITVPQRTYDATSLLAKLKVGELVCAGLVAPNEIQHTGWSSILVASPDDRNSNLRFLIQRILGIPSAQITTEKIDSLSAILDSEISISGSISAASYIPVCATLIVDVYSLLF